jgi:peptidylprolyl isomerase
MGYHDCPQLIGILFSCNSLNTCHPGTHLENLRFLYQSAFNLVANLEELIPVRGQLKMVQAKSGDTVKIHYTGKLNDGTVFDSSVNREPLEFTLARGQVIPGFEQAVLGMTPGESKTQTIPMTQAYGPYREEMVIQVNREQLPPDLAPEVGQQLQVQQPDGQAVPVFITEVTDSQVTLDANHPLAGEDLIFDIQLVEIV